jgi:predicted ATPase/class 3 adenylate cyclase
VPAVAATVTFLFTDIEGSTRLWDEHPEAMRDALLQHDTLLQACIDSSGGRVFKTIGDAFCAAFDSPSAALSAALAAQQRLPALALETAGGPRPLRVRMALHTGLADERDGDYFGPPLNRVARLLALAHGGQVLLSQTACELARDELPPSASLRPLGEHRLKDLSRPEAVFQLCHPELRAEFPPLRSLDSPELPNNLPQQVTSFIGREKELGEVKALLGRTRLLTLTGAGGTGKSRLALQAAADLLEGFPEGAWLAELAPLGDPALVPSAAASALGLTDDTGRPTLRRLLDYLKGRQVLLILDNCEHLLDACAALADAILRACPLVTILATSREGLAIAGETTYRVPSLTLPDRKRDATLDAVLRCEAARLFLERAEQAQPGFRVAGESAGALASLCCRLDGIPLAIELAAARVRSLTLEDITARLDQRFRLLTGGSRTALPRQQTLRSLIDWSYDLLKPVEQALLCRLSVFAGGWTLEAAEAVCGSVEVWEFGSVEAQRSALDAQRPSPTPIPREDILDLLSGLADKSLLVAETAGVSVRYRMLETVRQYARDRLLERGEGQTWRDRHLQYCLSLAEEAERHWRGPDEGMWHERLEAEHDNLRAALEWCDGDPGRAAMELRLAAALARFWSIHGHLTEGRERLTRALDRAPRGEGALRARALNSAGYIACKQGDYPRARALHEAALAAYRELDDRRGIADTISHLSFVAVRRGDYSAARALAGESLAASKELQHRMGAATSLNVLGIAARGQGDFAAARGLHEEARAIWAELGSAQGVATALINLSTTACDQGDFASARARCEEVLPIYQELGDRGGIALVLRNRGRVAQAEGNLPEGRSLLEESLRIRREMEDRDGLAELLESFAHLLAAEARPPDAARLWGAAEALREQLDAQLAPARDVWAAAVRTVLGEQAFEAAWLEGRRLTLEQAIDLALQPPAPERAL